VEYQIIIQKTNYLFCFEQSDLNSGHSGNTVNLTDDLFHPGNFSFLLFLPRGISFQFTNASLFQLDCLTLFVHYPSTLYLNIDCFLNQSKKAKTIFTNKKEFLI